MCQYLPQMPAGMQMFGLQCQQVPMQPVFTLATLAQLQALIDANRETDKSRHHCGRHCDSGSDSGSDSDSESDSGSDSASDSGSDSDSGSESEDEGRGRKHSKRDESDSDSGSESDDEAMSLADALKIVKDAGFVPAGH
jgi:hypothetical protein